MPRVLIKKNDYIKVDVERSIRSHLGKGKTMTMLACKIGKTPQAVSHKISNPDSMSVVEFIIFCRELGYTPEEVLKVVNV